LGGCFSELIEDKQKQSCAKRKLKTGKVELRFRTNFKIDFIASWLKIGRPWFESCHPDQNLLVHQEVFLFTNHVLRLYFIFKIHWQVLHWFHCDGIVERLRRHLSSKVLLESFIGRLFISSWLRIQKLCAKRKLKTEKVELRFSN
jgi:hypothetical protein